MSLIEKFSKVRNCKELFIANSSSYKTRIRQCWFYFFKFPSLHAFPFLRFDEKEKKNVECKKKKKKRKEEKKKKNNGGRLESFANDYVLM